MFRSLLCITYRGQNGEDKHHPMTLVRRVREQSYDTSLPEQRAVMLSRYRSVKDVVKHVGSVNDEASTLTEICEDQGRVYDEAKRELSATMSLRTRNRTMYAPGSTSC